MDASFHRRFNPLCLVCLMPAHARPQTPVEPGEAGWRARVSCLQDIIALQESELQRLDARSAPDSSVPHMRPA